MTAPRIGITTYREPARWGEWTEPADLLPALYSSAVQGAGGVAVLLPPAPATHAGPALDGVHALVVAGGPDVDPGRYHAQRDASTGGAREERDGWELELVREALDRDLPVLGVCRGMQVLNTALGGTLIQHLPDVVGTDVHAPLVGAHGRHFVTLEAGSRLAVVCGERIEIATHHHQALDELGAGLKACGWADDGTVEAVELADRRWTMGVQWHPEAYKGEALFAALITAAAHYRPAGARG
ncbi:MAG: gamma-glutamyl-gamma-aminobutyrate hydrolase family protein [Jatrophihabitans sp.]|uniref:gamma-glutamyl-gamma-aminobutyrate hydrolase family protein n=1 Tax=Jatrophihabitans sp. TaxID=1932789 RepID=UPI00390D8A19